jgi:Lon protease-like protein
MAAPPPRLEDLPASIPVFPLAGALLLPGGRLPLNIFEPRYVAMIEDALGHGRVFGMIQPDPHRSRGPTGPAIYRIGCLGRLSAFSETDDGRFLITLTGLIRFTVVEELAPCHGYRRVRADLTGFAGDLAPPPPSGHFDRPALLADLHGYFARQGIEANWEAIDQMDDTVLVTTLCMVCPFDVPERQALLEAPAPADRAASLRALLAFDAHAGITDRPTQVS